MRRAILTNNKSPFRRLRPNNRLKLTGPALKGIGHLCAGGLVPQGEALAPAGARPAA